MADNHPDYAAVIRAQGGEFLGVQLGPHGALILFVDPEARTTLAVPESDFSPQLVSQRLQDNRRAYDLAVRVQNSLC